MSSEALLYLLKGETRELKRNKRSVSYDFIFWELAQELKKYFSIIFLLYLQTAYTIYI